MSPHPQSVSLAGVGLAFGVLSGLLGVGGGFILVPVLQLLFGVPYGQAVAATTCQMIGASSAATVRQGSNGLAETRIPWVAFGGVMVGAHLGVQCLGWLAAAGSVPVLGRMAPYLKVSLQPAYALLLVVIGVNILKSHPSTESSTTARGGWMSGSAPGPYVSLPRVGLRKASIPGLACLGVVSGLLSGLFGVGGGVVVIPALTWGLGFRFRVAAATANRLLLLTVIASTWAHALAGSVDLRLVLPLLFGSGLGAHVGATWMVRIRPRGLRSLFCVLVVLGALLLLRDSVLTWRRSPEVVPRGAQGLSSDGSVLKLDATSREKRP